MKDRLGNTEATTLMNDNITAEQILEVNVIDIPRKVWLPKVKNEFKPEKQYSDVDEGYLILNGMEEQCLGQNHGNQVYGTM